MTEEFNHEPQDYHCPFCALLAGHYNDLGTKEDIVYQNEFATAKIAPKWWINNPGHVLVVPNKHYENIYDIPEELIGHISKVCKKIALNLKKTLGVQAVNLIHGSGKFAQQDVFHFHMHVVPRKKDDNFKLHYDPKLGIKPKFDELLSKIKTENI